MSVEDGGCRVWGAGWRLQGGMCKEKGEGGGWMVGCVVCRLQGGGLREGTG